MQIPLGTSQFAKDTSANIIRKQVRSMLIASVVYEDIGNEQ